MRSKNEVKRFANELQVGSAVRPSWITNLSYFLVLLGIGYFIFTADGGGLEGPNPIFVIVLAIWLVYTPIAVRKKWFAIRL